MMDGYAALRESAAWFDLSARGKIFASGEDRARLLHALTTNHVQQLAPGSGCYAFFLNAQGRILADANLLCFEDRLLIDTEPETRERIFQHIDHYIIADDVALEDASRRLRAIAVEGPEAAAALAGLGAPVPPDPYSHAAWGERIVARLSVTGAPGFRIFGPDMYAPPLREADPEAVRTVRLEHATPRYGEDFSETTIAQEARLAHALHFSKGCYLGQEIVERVRSRGHLNRMLVGLTIEGETAVAAGAKLTHEGVEVGEVSSSAFSPALGRVVAMGTVRAAHAAPGSVISCEGYAGMRTSRIR